jgi:hypothetical protein
MHWQDAVAKSSAGKAKRIVEGKILYIRSFDGSATKFYPIVSYLRGGDCEPREVEGYLDWEPVDPMKEVT